MRGMNDTLTVHVDGIGWCSPGLADWSAARTALRDGGALARVGAAKGMPTLLPANERRRAPEIVQLACDVAGQACAMSGHAASDLPCVFATMHGDLAITENLCVTLAANPLELSPTRFHNSVLNAAAGYWTVATQCHAASNAVSASGASFAAGLFEAAVEAHADGSPTLFAASDARTDGVLAETMQLATTYAIALVLNPQRGPHALATLRLRHDGRAQSSPPAITGTPFETALPLFAAIAGGRGGEVRIASGRASALAIEVLE
jgi:hypothetical protein